MKVDVNMSMKDVGRYSKSKNEIVRPHGNPDNAAHGYAASAHAAVPSTNS